MLKIKPLILGSLVTVGTFLLIISLFSLISLKIGVMADEMYFWFSSISLCLASLSGGAVSGKAAGERVLIYGLAVSFVVTLLSAFFSFLVFKSDFSVFTARAALVITASVIGSVISTVLGGKSRYV
ncbi:MAG: TIGR04086 family membrane protein [Ruminococcaceae bacterium]|nr:TIGR04086 family membrane protein [Oscillospiraceae bacterium]